MIRVPSHFNGAFVSRHFFPDWFKHKNLAGINGGQCYDWAYLAHRLFEGVQLWTTDYHAWIRIGRKFHDSETGRFGVLSFMELGCCRRNGPTPWEDQAPRQMELDEFKTFWNRQGIGHRFHWDTLLEDRLKTVLGKRYKEVTPIFPHCQPMRTIP